MPSLIINLLYTAIISGLSVSICQALLHPQTFLKRTIPITSDVTVARNITSEPTRNFFDWRITLNFDCPADCPRHSSTVLLISLLTAPPAETSVSPLDWSHINISPPKETNLVAFLFCTTTFLTTLFTNPFTFLLLLKQVIWYVSLWYCNTEGSSQWVLILLGLFCGRLTMPPHNSHFCAHHRLCHHRGSYFSLLSSIYHPQSFVNSSPFPHGSLQDMNSIGIFLQSVSEIAPASFSSLPPGRYSFPSSIWSSSSTPLPLDQS